MNRGTLDIGMKMQIWSTVMSTTVEPWPKRMLQWEWKMFISASMIGSFLRCENTRPIYCLRYDKNSTRFLGECWTILVALRRSNRKANSCGLWSVCWTWKIWWSRCQSSHHNTYLTCLGRGNSSRGDRVAHARMDIRGINDSRTEKAGSPKRARGGPVGQREEEDPLDHHLPATTKAPSSITEIEY